MSTSNARARQAAQAEGVEINAIAIEDMGNSAPITSFFRRWAITKGGFVVTARGLGDYPRAMREKLLRELTRASMSWKELMDKTIAAGIKLLTGFARSMAPIVNCVILDMAPVGTQEVSAIELVPISVSTKISGRETKAIQNGTPKKAWVTQAPARLVTGTPM